VEHRTYDGLGRVIRVQAPWPTAGAGGAGGYIVSRRFYYDGDRRIARVSTLPYSPTQGNVGDPGRIKGEIDLQQQIAWKPSTDRLWVWDPSDTDRLVAVYGDSPDNAAPSSPLARAWPVVTDLDGTPVAVLDHATGSVVSRCEFDATGNLLSSSLTTAPDGKYPPRLEVGWKGLFAERLDAPLTDSVVVSEDA
jgi:hypothetical protein